MQTTAKVLVIEDDADGRAAVADVLEEAGFQVVVAADGMAGLSRLEQERFDVALVDLRLPDLDGLQVLERIRGMPQPPAVILMTAYGTVEKAVAALRAGAYDFILKPLNLGDLQSRVGRAAETVGLRAEVASLRHALSAQSGGRPLVFVSGAMRRVMEQVRAVASTKATVLVVGESGVGKELIARSLHFGSDRAAAPLVAVNCGAFAESLLESELFGHEKGAFTGAVERHPGAFERAQGGTMFLDEIGIAPTRVQERLLRVLEEREITRLGGRQPVALDVRVVAASNRDPESLVAEGVFRRDLLYRLQVITIKVPPLRERPEDIRPLADHFIALACAEHGRHVEEVTSDYYEALQRYAWPGNVRELKHAVEVSVLMADTARLTAAGLQTGAGQPPAATSMLPRMTMAELERLALTQALDRHQGRRIDAAAELGVSTRTIQRKIREYDLPF
ncbi:MAG: sigma-54-dependent transcriptional regulator [Kiritimatiellia bacterium]